jgi:hypothetical protein
MEVRCGKCNKLFRVSDDKITGIGIRFSCTRCGEYVRITQADFQKYTSSRSTAPALDQFQPKPGPPAVLFSETEGPGSSEAAPKVDEAMTLEPAASSDHEEAREEQAPPFVEPEPVAPAGASEQAVEMRPEPLMSIRSETKPPAPAEPQPQPQEEQELSLSSAPAGEPIAPKMEASPPASSKISPDVERLISEPVYSAAPSRSGRKVLVLFGLLIIFGLAGYGAVIYLHSSPQQKTERAAHEVVSNEGLQIVNPVGAIDANGDLIVTGVIENAMDKERNAWYVVLEVYDAQGAVLSKIRLLNGNQIYNRRDYDILAKRGANVQELKKNLLQERGIVVPPKGAANFEARYLQPPAGIASFIAQVLPFDREQLKKEIAETIK